MYEVTIECYVFSAEVIYYSPHVKGHTNCLPGDAYPEEPEELEWLAHTGSRQLNSLINNCLSDEAYKEIDRQILEQLHSSE